MIRNAMFVVGLLIAGAMPVLAQQDTTLLFYRPNALNDSNQNPTIYALSSAGNRKLATIAKGEFFALQMRPGTHAFSWTDAPARDQQVSLTVGSGQQVFLQVQFRSITQTATDSAPINFQGLQPIGATRVFDSAVLIPPR